MQRHSIAARSVGVLATSLSLYLASADPSRGGEPPQVQFDLPARLEARELHAPSGHARLIEVNVPVSARVIGGDIHKIEEVTIEVDGGGAELVVHDFTPQTTLGTELADDIQVTTTTEQARSLEASLGGQSPIPIGDVVSQITPSISGGNKHRTAETQTTSRRAPRHPVVVSGTLNEGRGVFFQLRPSSQTTLEGQHQLTVVFRAPSDWQSGSVDVRCWARGERQILWFDRPQVWGSAHSTVAVALPEREPQRHRVAKQPTDEATDQPRGEWVPVADP